jgi:hypothetical protein
MNLKEKLSTIAASEKANGSFDYVAGGGLIGGALYADLANGLHILALVAGTLIILMRVPITYRAWKRGRRRRNG